MKKIEAYEYSVSKLDGKLKVKKVYFIEEWEPGYNGWKGYRIEQSDPKAERRTHLNCITKIEEGVYQCPYHKDHIYTIEKNPRRALELLIKYHELRAEEFKVMLSNALGKVKYLKFQLKEMEEEE